MRVFFAAASEAAEAWACDLPQEKRERISRLRRQEDRLLHLTAHRLLCWALGEVFGMVPALDDWGLGQCGKPYLKNAEGIHFNISHSGDMAMCVVHSAPVGADIERIHPVNDGPARHIMSEQEWRAYRSAEDKDRLFFRVWTLKEAYVKYRGIGLGDVPKGLTVYSGADRVNVPGCAFSLIDDIPGYQAAVCAGDVVCAPAEWVREL